MDSLGCGGRKTHYVLQTAWGARQNTSCKSAGHNLSWAPSSLEDIIMCVLHPSPYARHHLFWPLFLQQKKCLQDITCLAPPAPLQNTIFLAPQSVCKTGFFLRHSPSAKHNGSCAPRQLGRRANHDFTEHINTP